MYKCSAEAIYTNHPTCLHPSPTMHFRCFCFISMYYIDRHSNGEFSKLLLPHPLAQLPTHSMARSSDVVHFPVVFTFRYAQILLHTRTGLGQFLSQSTNIFHLPTIIITLTQLEALIKIKQFVCHPKIMFLPKAYHPIWAPSLRD